MNLERGYNVGELAAGSLEFEPTAIIGQEQFTILSELMVEYGVGTLNTSQVIDVLMEKSRDGEEFYFNLNTDIQRLLIHKPPFKITLSTDSDNYAFKNFQADMKQPTSSKISVTVGKIDKGQEYENRQLLMHKSALKRIIEDRKILGLYGQLSFPSSDSSSVASEYFANLLQIKDANEYVVLHSGSLIGVSAIVYELLQRSKLLNIGIIPHSIEHLVEKSRFSSLIVEGDDWGDASYLFGGLPDEIVFAGGGHWSYLEYKKAIDQAKNIKFLDFEGVRYCNEFDDGIDKERIKIL